MNFAVEMGQGKLPGTSLDAKALLPGAAPPDADSALAALEAKILAGDVSPQTHAVMEKQLNDPQISQRKLDDRSRAPHVGAIPGLIMGSPECQRRLLALGHRRPRLRQQRHSRRPLSSISGSYAQHHRDYPQ